MTFDPYFNQVQLLVGADSGISDESPAGRTITQVGSVAASATQAKFGGQSVRFPDAQGISHSSYFYVADAASLEFGSNSFTAECWFYLDSLTPTTNDLQMLLAKHDDITAQQSWYLAYDGTNGGPHQLEFYASALANGSGDTIFLQGGTITAAGWHFAAVDFDGTTYRVYLNTAMVASDTFALGAIADTTARLSVGGHDRGGSPGRTLKVGYIDEARVTIGTARYASDTTITVPTAAFPREGPPPNAFLDTLTETVNFHSLAGEFTNTLYWEDSSDSFTVGQSDALLRLVYGPLSETVRTFAYLLESKGYPTTISETLNLTPALAVVKGVLLADIISIAQAQATTGIYGKALTDSAEFEDLVRIAVAELLGDTVNVSEALAPVLGAVVLEQLNIAPTVVASALYGKTFVDTVRLADSLAQFLGADVSDAITLTSSLVELARLSGVTTDAITISETTTPSLIFNVTTEDDIEITPSEVLNMLYSDTLLDGVEITAGYLSPGGGLTTWVMNTRTTAVTEYDNFDFNSFAMMGAKYIGASSTGLYELNGDTDDGSDIIARIRGGYMQFGGTKLSRLKSAYIAARGEGDFVLRIDTGDGATYSYAVSTREMRSTKVHMGKGQRARYFAFELISAGQDFDLDTLEFVPVVMRRRV